MSKGAASTLDYSFSPDTSGLPEAALQLPLPAAGERYKGGAARAPAASAPNSGSPRAPTTAGAPPASAAGAPAMTRERLDGINRLQAVWNGWFFAPGEPKAAVKRLQPGNTYKYRLDLSRYSYEVARGSRIAPAVARVITKSAREGRKTVELIVRPKLVGPLEFSSEPRLEKKLVIDISKLVVTDAIYKSDAVAWQQANDKGLLWLSQQLSADAVEYNVEAGNGGDCGFVLLTIWNDTGLTPLDALAHAVPVGDTADGCGTEEKGADALQSLSGGSHLFQLAGLSGDASPDAALHVFEVQHGAKQRTFAFFVDRDAYLSAIRADDLTGSPSSFGFHSWELASKFSFYLGDLLPKRIFQIRRQLASKEPPKYPYADAAEQLAGELFTALEDREAPERSRRDVADAEAARAAVARLGQDARPRSIYIARAAPTAKRCTFHSDCSRPRARRPSCPEP